MRILERVQVFLPLLTIEIVLFFLVKISKYRKQNTMFSHPPKNQRNFVHFFPLASKSGWIKKLKALYRVKWPLITNSNHWMPLFFVSTFFYRLGQKYVQNYVGFLADERTWYFAFDIYWPLVRENPKKSQNSNEVKNGCTNSRVCIVFRDQMCTNLSWTHSCHNLWPTISFGKLSIRCSSAHVLHISGRFPFKNVVETSGFISFQDHTMWLMVSW